jgi:hypothetical protein
MTPTLPRVGGVVALQVIRTSSLAEKAESPMLITLAGMVKLVILPPLKAPAPMLVTELGMVNATVSPPGYVCKTVLPVLYKTPPSATYAVLPASTVIVVRLVHQAKALFPRFVTLLGIDMLVSLEQLPKADVPMLVTLSGMIMLKRLEQELKAELPMVVTPFPKSTLVKLQSVKAEVLMVVTVSGIITLVILLHI